MIFNRLHCHSDLSTRDAIAKVESLVAEAKKRKCTALAITEHGNLASSFSLWREARKEGIKPILGVEAYYVDYYDTPSASLPYNYSHIIILAMNEKGWQNLKDMMAEAWKIGFLRVPRVSLDLLTKYNEGLIISTACVRGLIGYHVLSFNKRGEVSIEKGRERALKRIQKLKAVFGDRLYLEVMLHSLEDLKKYNPEVIAIAKKEKIKVIVTHDTHYIQTEDWILHDIVLCVMHNSKLGEENNGTYESKEYDFGSYKFYLRQIKEYHTYITKEQLKRWLHNTVQLASRVEEFEYRTKESSLPVFCENADEFLTKTVGENAKKRKIEKKEYKDRIDYELGMIKQLGFASYFLLVWDVANFCREKKIPYNARGSVCGSLVAFLLGITIVDPIYWNTPFERFLTPDRISLPDIDADVGRKERQEVIEYIREKYGKEHVAHIINFTEWKPKGAVKDVSRVLGIPFDEANTATRTIPDAIKNWDELTNPDPKLTKFFDKYEDVEGYARRLQGFYRQTGLHASGIIITPGKMTKWVPVANAKSGDVKGEKITELDMYDLEDLDVLKLDILGQTTLDVIRDTLVYKEVPWNNFDELAEFLAKEENIKDESVFANIRAGSLIGMFQLGTSKGMYDLTVAIEPKNIDDIKIIIGLYRPAILEVGMHEEYVERRFGKRFTYIHPKMAEVLDETEGVMLWQEQCMKMAVVMAGFTPIESDNFRKGIKQKDIEKFKPWKDKFIEGCQKVSNTTKRQAEQIWDFIEKFSGYSFNVSHATVYAIIAYMTAYLKQYYPVQFMCSLLSNNLGDDDKIQVYLNECRRLGIEIREPDINISKGVFSTNGKIIRYPITAIKMCGEKAINAILSERKENGRYESFEDFYSRVNKTAVRVNVMTNLILANVFGEFGSVDEIYNEMMEYRKDRQIRCVYCNMCDKRYVVTPRKGEEKCPKCESTDISTDDELVQNALFDMEFVKDSIYGFRTGASIDAYAKIILKEKCKPLSIVEEIQQRTVVKVAFQISSIKQIRDKNGNDMAFVDITDGSYETSVVVFSSEWDDLKRNVRTGNCYIGYLQKGNRGDNFMFFQRDGGVEKLEVK